jgi:DNA-binding NarL/FixJ family response regulator
VDVRLARILTDVGLGAVFAVALGGQALAIATSWGGGYWWFDLVAGTLVCGAALSRRRHLVPAVAAGLVVAAIAVVVARLADLPAEPGPAMVLGLSVLVGAAVRVLPVRHAVTVAGAEAVVVAGSWLTSPPDASGVGHVPVTAAAGWLAALVTGLCLRLLDVRRQVAAEQVRHDERLELARELHDVVAHHVTTFDLDEYVYGALRGGAVGFILKDAGPALLAEAVRAANVGEALVSPSVTVRLPRHLAGAGAPAALTRPLSERETEVVRFVARGRTNQEIAAALFISLSTVKSHVAGIQAKLGVRNRVQIAAWAWENHVVG